MRGSKRRSGVGPYLIIVLAALVVPVSVNLLRDNWRSLGLIGGRVASFGAALNMPGAGLHVLLERFRGELSPEPEDAAHVQAPLLPVPRQLEPEEKQREPASSSPGDGGGSRIQPRIPAQYRAELISENFSGTEGGYNLRFGAGLIRNDTKYTNSDVLEILQTPTSLSFSAEEGPLVLIVHTHATESFERYDSTVYDTRNNWRSTDNNNNMVAVGASLANALESRGIPALHDTIQHDYPSYNGSYERSARTVSAYLEQYPSIRVVLDLHRDAMERENSAIVKPVETVDGARAAQVMIIAGCDDGTMDMPGWRDNLRFAAAYQDAMERRYPGLTRPVLFSYRKYNQHLSAGALLLEFGSNANTLDEAVYAAKLAGEALADLIGEHT